MMGIARALWAYRGFIFGSLKREFQSRYRSSMLGAAWTVLNPLAMILVYTVIFSQLMRARLPGVDSTFGYGIYLCSGVLTWGLFAEITGRAQTMFIDNGNLLKKLSFPRLCLPVIVIGTALVNFTIIFTLFTAFLLISGNFPGLPFLALAPLLLIQIVFAIGLGITLGILNVFFRDVGQFFGIGLQFWFWLTPIVYPLNVLPEHLRSVAYLNPMTALVSGFQQVLVQGAWPEWRSLWFVTLLACAACLLGLRLFRRHSDELVDEL